MRSLEAFVFDKIHHRRLTFSRDEAIRDLSLSPEAFAAAADRLIRKHKLARPRHGFFVIQQPEHRIGGPNPILWIDSLMRYQEIDYRISLLTAACVLVRSFLPGRDAVVFRVMVPRQLRGFQLGRHRLHFVYQKLSIFESVNRPEWLGQIKNDEGFAKVAGIELTLLDCMRSYRNAAGIDGVAQNPQSDIGGKADPRKLATIAAFYENATVRRLELSSRSLQTPTAGPSLETVCRQS